MTQGRFRWQVFAGAVVASLAFHIGVVVPALLEPVAKLLQPREELEEVAMLDDSPVDPLPAADSPKLEPDKLESKNDKPKPLAKAPEPVKVAERKAELPKPVEVAPPQPPSPQPVIDKRKQMVSQDHFEEEKDNADAKYLAEKNHRVTEDTRTESTNLIRRAQGADHKSAPNENRDKEVGEKDQVIAELEQRRGIDLPRDAPQRGHEGQSSDKRETKPGPLSMRNLVPRTDERAELKQREGVERQETTAGDLPMQRQGHDGERGGATRKGGEKVKLSLDMHSYDNIEGFATAQKERREAALAQRSHVRGRYDKYQDSLGALRSALENFTPDVKVGNQAELGTRASPFAAYITSMHRQIHKIFTFGFLQDQQNKLGRGAFEDETLWTQIQISLNGDGTIDKLGIVRSSGSVPFDAVALDSVRSAGPFEKPPQAIRSANGKVYMDWQFHRNELACGTFGVDPHILTTPGENVEHDSTETGMPRRPLPARGGTGTGAAPTASTTTANEEPRRLQREVSESPAAFAAVPDITSEVKSAADGWFSAWTRGDVSWLNGWSTVPFQAGGKVVARDSKALASVYKQMVAEGGSRGVTGTEVLTPGGIRAKIGGLPPGGEENGMLFAVAQSGNERFVLLLKKTEQGWRVVGVVR